MKTIPPRARSAPFVPLCPKVPDLLEMQDRRFAFSDDRRALTLLGRQNHRSHHCRAQFHCAVICQGHKFFRVDGHRLRLCYRAALQLNQLGKSWFLIGSLNFDWLFKAAFPTPISRPRLCSSRTGAARGNVASKSALHGHPRCLIQQIGLSSGRF